MDDEIFVKHVNGRHRPMLANMGDLSVRSHSQQLSMWRSFHLRTHNEQRAEFDHEHVGEDTPANSWQDGFTNGGQA
jgi:hypothetical protein